MLKPKILSNTKVSYQMASQFVSHESCPHKTPMNVGLPEGSKTTKPSSFCKESHVDTGYPFNRDRRHYLSK